MAAATLRLLLPSPNPNPRPLSPILARATQHQRRSNRCSSSPTSPDTEPSLDLPLLPFQPSEVLIPSECKTLHLYEARFLALLEEALYRRKNSFVHFVLDPVVTSSPKASFAARYGCLVQIESIEKLEIGALVSIRGVCRVNIMNILQMEPFLCEAASPIMDKPCQEIELGIQVFKLRESICNLHNLQMKLKVPKDELLQTNIKGSLVWSEKEIFEEYNEDFIPKLAEQLSHSKPFQWPMKETMFLLSTEHTEHSTSEVAIHVSIANLTSKSHTSGMSDAEQLTLQKYKLQAMDSTDTLERLNSGIEYVEQSMKMIAARLAIQNL